MAGGTDVSSKRRQKSPRSWTPCPAAATRGGGDAGMTGDLGGGRLAPDLPSDQGRLQRRRLGQLRPAVPQPGPMHRRGRARRRHHRRLRRHLRFHCEPQRDGARRRLDGAGSAPDGHQGNETGGGGTRRGRHGTGARGFCSLSSGWWRPSPSRRWARMRHRPQPFPLGAPVLGFTVNVSSGYAAGAASRSRPKAAGANPPLLNGGYRRERVVAPEERRRPCPLPAPWHPEAAESTAPTRGASAGGTRRCRDRAMD